MKTRLEADSIGILEVPADAYYGVQSLRAKHNFPITSRPLHPEFIKSIVILKKAAALTNENAGELSREVSEAICTACDEILEGKLFDQFIVDAIQGGAGTSANMNANEVIANRADELLGGTKGSYQHVHPNDHVNMAQENQRPFGRRAVCPTFIRHIFISRKAGQEIAPAGSALVNRRIDPFPFKNLLNIIKRPFFISRWIGGINPDQVL